MTSLQQYYEESFNDGGNVFLSNMTSLQQCFEESKAFSPKIAVKEFGQGDFQVRVYQARYCRHTDGFLGNSLVEVAKFESATEAEEFLINKSEDDELYCSRCFPTQPKLPSVQSDDDYPF